MSNNNASSAADSLSALHASVLSTAVETGGSHEGYVKWACVAAASRGWRAVVLNMRGCNGLPLTSARGYNAINTADVHVAVQSIHRCAVSPSPACGFVHDPVACSLSSVQQQRLPQAIQLECWLSRPCAALPSWRQQLSNMTVHNADHQGCSPVRCCFYLLLQPFPRRPTHGSWLQPRQRAAGQVPG